jgi:hypothetical protein
MREFSKELVNEAERKFEIGGELFRWRYPYWEEFADRRDKDAEIVQQTDEQKNGEAEVTFKDIYQDFITRIEAFIDPANDGLKSWRTLAKRKIDPVPAYQFSELYMWLLEVTSARPTETLLSSSNGQEQTEDTSTEGSS